MRRLTGLAAIAAFAAMTSVGSATAEDEPEAKAAAASKFYQEVDAAKCSGGKCTATFAKIPSGRVLQTSNLSCNAKAGPSEYPAFATLQAGKTVLAYMPLNPFSTGDATGASAGVVYVPARSTPSVVISGGVQSATCTLSGTLAAD